MIAWMLTAIEHGRRCVVGAGAIILAGLLMGDLNTRACHAVLIPDRWATLLCRMGPRW